MLAFGLGVVFLVFSFVILDAEESPSITTAFYAVGAASIVIGAFVFLRDFRVERKRRRHVKKKGVGRPKDWDPKIGVTAYRDPSHDREYK